MWRRSISSPPVSVRRKVESEVWNAAGCSISLLILPLVCAGIPSYAAGENEAAKNLLPYAFQDADKNGFPDGYTRGKDLGGKIAYEPEAADRSATVQMDLEQESSAYLDSNPFRLEVGKDYLFTVEVMIKNLRFHGAARHIDHAVVFYVYSANGDRHAATWIVGEGSSPGWVRVMLPFSTKRMPQLAFARVLIRCRSMSGTVRFRNPAIIELPAGVRIGRPHCLLPDGTAVDGYDVLK